MSKSELYVFSGELIERAIIPSWKSWMLYLMPWRWKKIAPGTFVRHGSTWFKPLRGRGEGKEKI